MESRTYKMHVRVLLSRYRAYTLCSACDGARLNADALRYRVGGLDLAAWHRLEVAEAHRRLESLATRTGQGELARRELVSRLGWLVRVGLGYLGLDRQSRTLSGGEAQRVSLTAALGTGLTGALFVLDEPSVGLHPSDLPPLTTALGELARRGNAVMVLEHDPALIRASDRVLELGPGAGPEGGRLCFDGTPAALAGRTDLPTGRVLGAARAHARDRRAPRGWIDVRGASANNLADLDLRLPLGVLAAVCGPSGSGKSTLAEEVVYRTLARVLGQTDLEPAGAVRSVKAGLPLTRVVLVDQAPLGRTSRGNAATYTKAWDVLRKRFAAEPDAVMRGLGPAHFSFNVEGGRCEACSGEGSETVEMQFLADVALICPSCRGQRFRPEVLEVRLKGHSVSEVLAMTVDQALAAFGDDRPIAEALRPLQRLGLGYLPIGQPLSTLSGGEAQRVKLARALSGAQAGMLYVLDEPSAGLHGEDVARVLEALHGLVDAGASVLAVDHDLDLLSSADWLLELGPGGGREGGRVVAEGAPEEVARASSRTGEALRTATGSPRTPAPLPAATGGPCMEVEHAREHNLVDVSCRIPLGKLVVLTGPSGSGKSTLAFDVVFAEAQRRFTETLSPYARQFLPTLPRPDVERIRGLPPAVALEQRTARAGATSTVATVTEVAHYLRLLFAKLGTPHCPNDDTAIAPRSAEQLLDEARAGRGAIELLAPVVRARKGTYLDVFTAAARAGVKEAVCDGTRVSTDAPPKLARSREHTIDLVVWSGPAAELPDEAFRQALRWGQGAVKVLRGGPTPPGGRLRTGARAPASRASPPNRVLPARGRGSSPSPAGCASSTGATPRSCSSRWCGPSRRCGAGRSPGTRLASEARRWASSSAGWSSWSGWVSAISRWTAPRRRSAAARCSASGSRPRPGQGSPARSTCWTSRPSACTPATPGGCWRTSERWWTPGARCWWWSTTWTRSAPPTTWWTSVRAAAASEAASWPRARPRRCWPRMPLRPRERCSFPCAACGRFAPRRGTGSGSRARAATTFVAWTSRCRSAG